MKNNKGFSLVELIIVIGMIALMAGVSSLGYAMVSGKPAEQCARSIASSLNHSRTVSIGKYATYTELYRDSDENIYIELFQKKDEAAGYVSVRKKTVGNKNVKVTCNGADLGSVKIGFDRSTGALTDKVGGSEAMDVIGQIVVTKANTTMSIEIDAVTGKITVRKM